ncbi:MAG TPA: hypothetical protein VFO39_09025 [Candidatus Sulfotelmatobacter sp.]|nr:hypothetical protein [Candidatus Sulfotelmatobacter sp.]
MIWYFVFFLISGFCSILYELVWLRLAMAQFGVTTAMVSIILSVFMAGLGLGSWASGRLIRNRSEKSAPSAMRVYAAIEFLIGISGVLVPLELRWGHTVLERLGDFSSASYYVASGTWAALTIVPWCMLMGATIPVAMLAIRRAFPPESARSFSYLYVANVAGAVAGTRIPLYLIELFGFHGTLRAGTTCNFLIAAGAWALSLRQKSAVTPTETPSASSFSASPRLLALLFATGLSSMGMELVWVRQFTPFLGTVVYGFSSILSVYLTGTFVGSLIYRRWGREHAGEVPLAWKLLALFALLPLIAADPATPLWQIVRLIFGIAPFTALLGYLTPMLVDRWSGGDPDRAGTAYAVNVIGCIVGPLLAGFILLPHLSERWSIVLLALPWFAVGLQNLRELSQAGLPARISAYAMLPLAALIIWQGHGYEEKYATGRVLRDPTATVIATGKDRRKRLLVNGYGMTVLTPMTKMMAHLPLTLLNHQPQNALDICFGMGTTYRSLLSWNIHTTAVELVPSVPQLFGYFHSDAAQVLQSSYGTVVIDDGRRYLERTAQQYDLITIDPPPPVEAAGSSMLYSEEFYAAARRRLRAGGILEQWLPYGDPQDKAAFARAFRDSFPYTRIFRWQQNASFHMLGSDQPIPNRTPEEMLDRMPPEAVADLTEWSHPTAQNDRPAIIRAVFAQFLQTESSVDALIALSPTTPALRDDRPINEYYVLRRGTQDLGDNLNTE